MTPEEILNEPTAQDFLRNYIKQAEKKRKR
jgi:hypothetical protein